MITRAHPLGFASEWNARLAEANRIIAELERDFAAAKTLKSETVTEVNSEITRLVAVLVNTVSK